MVRAHQPGQAVFRPTLPEDIDWEPFPAFPPSARLAVVVGDPSEPAPYVVRVKLPSGVKLMPHRHHEDRVYTVMSGVFYIGLGEQFDAENCRPTRRVASSCCLPVRRISTGRNPVSTHPGDGDRADQPRIPGPGGRPAEQNRHDPG